MLGLIPIIGQLLYNNNQFEPACGILSLPDILWYSLFFVKIVPSIAIDEESFLNNCYALIAFACISVADLGDAPYGPKFSQFKSWIRLCIVTSLFFKLCRSMIQTKFEVFKWKIFIRWSELSRHQVITLDISLSHWLAPAFHCGNSSTNPVSVVKETSCHVTVSDKSLEDLMHVDVEVQPVYVL